MQSDIQITNRNDTCFVDIEGVIGVPEEWQFDQPSSRVATYEKFRDSLDRLREIDAPEIVVNIRSTGGDVNDALLIYEALSSLDGHIVTRCYGYTASAATVIAQAASEGCREISAHALYLIHNSICTAEGNAEELATRIDLLRKTDARLAEVYAARSGRTPEEFTLLMAENNGSGRWLSPQEALAAGLVDRIIEPAATEKTPAAQATPAGQWRKLLGKLGLVRPADALPPDRNILHFGDPEKGSGLRTSELALHEGQQFAAPTRTLPREDPSIGETTPSANQRAYAEDAKQLTRPPRIRRPAFGYPPQNRYTRTDSIRSNNPFNHQKSNYLMSALENAKTYTGKNLETIFFRPMLSGPSAIDLGVRVLYNMPVPTTVQMWEPKTDILQKFTAAGWSGGAGSKKLQKTIPLNRVKAELGYSAADYFSLVYELITNRPEVNMEDLTGTELEEAETTLFKQAIAESIRSTMWVGDTSAESGANTFDGFLKTIATYSNNNKVYTYNYETDAMNTPANSVAMFDDLWKNADERLKDLKAEGQLAFFVSSDVYSAYEKHLDSMSTDGAYTDYINGRQNLLYHGIPVVDLRISSYLAKLSSSSPVPKSFCILTDRRNLVLAVNTADFPGNEIRMWYNPDEMENRQRAVFMAGCDVLDEGLVAFASRI